MGDLDGQNVFGSVEVSWVEFEGVAGGIAFDFAQVEAVPPGVALGKYAVGYQPNTFVFSGGFDGDSGAVERGRGVGIDAGFVLPVSRNRRGLPITVVVLGFLEAQQHVFGRRSNAPSIGYRGQARLHNRDRIPRVRGEGTRGRNT